MRITLALVGLGLAAGCSQLGEQSTHSKVTDVNRGGVSVARDDDEDEQQVALAELPPAVRAAALAAVSGLMLESAELEVEDGVTMYSIEGTANGVKYCVEVSPEGQVLATEIEDDDDDDNDDNDDDDGDGDD